MTVTLPSPIQWPVGSIPTSTYVTFPTGHRSGIYYVGDTVSMTLNQNGPGLKYDGSTTQANAYVVRDLTGTVVGSGSIPQVFIPPPGGGGNAVGATFTLVPTAGGNWKPGVYRVTLTGPTFDSYHQYAYGATTFIVLRDNPNFFHNPDSHGLSDSYGGGAESRDVILKGVLGMGGSRDIISTAYTSDPLNPGAGGGDNLLACAADADSMIAYQPADPARVTIPFNLFPNGTNDTASLAIGYAYVKAGVDGSKTYVSCGAGTTSGIKVTVYYPNNSTIVETWDNQGNSSIAASAINASSAYIRLVATGGSGTTGPTLIGNAYRTGVMNTVNYLYPHGVQHYEGPQNEGGLGAVIVENLRVFRQAVKDANASAVVMGPCPVDINQLTAWQGFFDLGGGALLDKISTHMYGLIASDFNSSRGHLDAWFDLLKRNGQGGKEVWVTESTQANGVAGILYQPAATWDILKQILLLEQYGVPREHNLIWYDRSHGFWNVPNWLEYGDGAVAPHGVFCRVMAEETLGMHHHHPIDFGSVQGNRMFLGSVFKHISDGTQTAMILTAGNQPGASITFGVAGTVPANFTICDGEGNTSTVSVSAGKVIVPLDKIARYVRIPSGTYLYVSSCNDWGANPPPSISPAARATFHGTDYKPRLVDNGLLLDYASGAGFSISNQAVPDTAEVIWQNTVNVDRVIVFAGLASQPYSTLTDFDVETSADGITWVVRQTRTVDILANVFVHPTDFRNSATTVENYWNPRWVFDVSLGGTFVCKGIRLSVRATSFGGMNIQDLAAVYGNPVQQITLQEITVPSLSATTPYSAGYVPLVLGTPGLLGFWRFAEPTGATVAVSEVSSPAIDGTYTVTPPHTSVSAPGPISDGKTARVSVGGASFDVPANGVLNFGDTFSIEFWHNSFSGNTAGTIFQAVYPNGQQVAINFNGGRNYSITDGQSIQMAGSSEPNFGPDGNWHHIVFTKTGATTKVYLDGKDVTVAGGAKTYVTSLGIIRLFAPGGNSTGFANLSIYNTVLSAGAVVDRFNSATLPSTIPVLDSSFFAPNPVVSGSPYVGEQLQCSTGLWQNSPTQHFYQWQVSANGTSGWADRTGATRSDLSALAAGDLGLYFRCQVRGANVIGTATPVNSNVIGPITNPPTPILNTGLPVLSGVSKVEHPLTCSVGTYSGSPSVFYFQWQISATGTGGWSIILGATTNTYSPSDAQEGLYLRCGTRAEGGSLVYSYSAASAKIEAFGPRVVVAPSITGVGDIPSTLSSNPGSWSD